MSRCQTINFQFSIMSKWPPNHISTKVSFKITIRKRYVYIDIRWPWIWNQYFYLGIEMMILVLPSIQLPTRLNSQNTKESVFINELDNLICVWILVFSICIIEVSSPLICSFWLYFSSLHDYWPPTTWNAIVHTSLGKMVWCEKRAFQLLKMRKKKSAETKT
jgi:hypothetical protein